MTQNNRKTVALSLTEYKIFVANCIQRLIEQECFTVKVLKKEGEIGTDVKIDLIKPEWFKLLDNNAQNIIFDNLQSQIVECLKNNE